VAALLALGTTMAYGLTLVTADQRLLSAEWLPTLAAA
jgi:hypothetical protein